jgi:phosphonate transport system substrate-binding protein
MKYLFAIIVGIAGLYASGCSPEQGAATARDTENTAPTAGNAISLKKVVVALKPDKNPDKMLQEKQALEKVLGTRLGKPVEVIIPLSSSVIMEGMVNGTIDLGYVSATDMILARERGAAEVLVAGEIKGKPYYSSYWVALSEKPYSRVEDLKGRPIAFSSRTSTSGFLIPAWDLVKKGLVAPGASPEEFFGRGNVWFGVGYVSAVERVLSGEVEAAAVSDYVLDEDRHLTPEQRGRLKKVAEQGPVPTHVIAVRASLSESDRAILKEAIRFMNEPAQQELRDKVFTSKLIEVSSAAHLAPLREAFEQTGITR